MEIGNEQLYFTCNFAICFYITINSYCARNRFDMHLKVWFLHILSSSASKQPAGDLVRPIRPLPVHSSDIFYFVSSWAVFLRWQELCGIFWSCGSLQNHLVTQKPHFHYWQYSHYHIFNFYFDNELPMRQICRFSNKKVQAAVMNNWATKLRSSFPAVNGPSLLLMHAYHRVCLAVITPWNESWYWEYHSFP